MEIDLIDKNILVTGGTGFVGSHLIEELTKYHPRIVTTYYSINPKSYFFSQKLYKKTTMVCADICNYEKIYDLVTKFRFDYIFHLAAQALVDVAYDNPKQTLYTNVLGTVNILESARLYGKTRAIIIASSDKAYGKLNKERYLESDHLRGDHPYEVSKSAADLISYSYYKTYNLPVVTTRFGNIYGEGDLNFSRILPGVMKSIINKQILEIRSNGKYIRDYLYVKDVVSGYLLLANNINKVQGEAFNFGSSDTFSVLDLIELVEKTLGREIVYKIMNSAKNEISYQSLDYSKINKKLGWKPKYHFKQQLKDIYRWYTNYFER